MDKIVVEKVSKVFNKHSRSANRVLKGVSFSLPPKGLICIFGKSGSGKTTLLNIIGGLDRADEGKVYIDGECTAGKADRIRNEKIGFIFQNYYLERGYTIAEILRNQMMIAGVKDEAEIKKRTEEALKLVDMERFKNKRGDALSGGQQQRVAIARAIVKGSDIILADEPTGNLDAENTVKVMDILKEISKKQLVVVVTHEVTLIKRYADSYIKIVDGELRDDIEIDESEVDSVTYQNMFGSEKAPAAVPKFEKSTAKRNGRLFSFQNIVRSMRADKEEKMYSTGNMFKRIFILVMAVVVCFFSFAVFEVLSTKIDNKPLEEGSIYTNLNAYSVLRKMEENEYQTIDFFDTHRKEGSFSYGGIASVSGATVTYSPKAIEEGETLLLEYGRLPEKGEVVVSRALAEELKKQLRLKNLQTDKAVTLTDFDDDYRISGIAEGNDRLIWFNKVDYVNFLGVYNNIAFSDAGGLLFTEHYGLAGYTAEIMLYEGNIDVDKVRVEINRNSLYKMMDDPREADFLINKTNSILKRTPYAIQVTDSKVYVEQFWVTREPMTTDIRLHMSADTLKNIFVYMSPGMDALSGGDLDYYFEVKTADAAQHDTLKETLRSRGVTAVNIEKNYENENKELMEDASRDLYLYGVVILLLLAIYFFIEKSGSIKNSKEYGIYRAIGVNRSNLLFKECVNTVIGDLSVYLLCFFVTDAVLCKRYAVMNVGFGGFIGMSAGLFLLSSLIMIGISLVPYLFVLYKTPSQILAGYDI